MLKVRVFLSLAGVASCVLGLAASYGLMFLLGLEYNQFHKVLPFIATGEQATLALLHFLVRHWD